MDKTSTYTMKARSLVRPLVLLPALVVGLSVAFTAAASAQTAFQTTAIGHIRTGEPCAQTIPPPYVPENVLCGSANIAGYTAVWTDNVLTAVPGATPACTAYTSITTFRLSDGDTLVLDEPGLNEQGLPEHGSACSPGNTWNNSRKNPFGAPWSAGEVTSNGMVDTTGVYGVNTGVFARATGAGALTGQWAGPEVRVTYTGTLS